MLGRFVTYRERQVAHAHWKQEGSSESATYRSSFNRTVGEKVSTPKGHAHKGHGFLTLKGCSWCFKEVQVLVRHKSNFTSPDDRTTENVSGREKCPNRLAIAFNPGGAGGLHSCTFYHPSRPFSKQRWGPAMNAESGGPGYVLSQIVARYSA